MMEKLALVGASAQGVSQFEKDRLKRIEENKKRMIQMMAGADISLLVRQPQVTPAKPRKRKSDVVVTSERRKSSRISNLPTPLYCIDEDLTDRTPASRNRTSSGPTGRHFHGIAANRAGNSGGDGDLYLSGKKGWKIECGSASLEAADAATDAAVGLQRQITEAGGHASVKLMSASQVSGGFWSQLPYDVTTHYGNTKRIIHLHCDDKAHQDPASFQHSVPGSSTCWPVVYLPKQDGQGFGLSGGWRGFAIDMRLFPNDTVVHEVLDCDPRQSTGAAAGAGNMPSGSSDEDSNTDCDLSQQSAKPAAAAGGGSDDKVAPHTRMHMRIHIFRASAFEKTDTAAAAAVAAEGGEAASHQQSQQTDSACLLATREATAGELVSGSDSQDEEQQHNTQLCRSGSAEDSTTTAAAAAAAEDDDDSLDLPLAKRAKRVPGAAAGVAVTAAAAAAGQGVDLMAAAEAGFVSGVKVLRQSSRIRSSSSKESAGGRC